MQSIFMYAGCLSWVIVVGMTSPESARQRLAVGDKAREQREAGVSAWVIAQRMGISEVAVRKAAWLADTFPPETRRGLGDVLDELGPSHLEAVAAVSDHGIRDALLAAAAAERLTVRDLRRRVADAHAAVPVAKPTQQIGQVVILGGADELSRAQRAVERYAAFTDAQLDRLLAGPTGPAVRGLTRAAQSLAERLGARPPTPCPATPTGV